MFIIRARSTSRTSAASVKIEKLDLANKQIIVPAVTGAAATDVILPEGLTGATPVGSVWSSLSCI